MPKAKAEKPKAKAKAPTKAIKVTSSVKTAPKPVKTSKVTTKEAKVAIANPKKQKDSTVKLSTLKIDVYDMKGKVIENITLPREIFGAKVNRPLLAQAVHVYQVNQRQGNAQAKTRGQVKGSTKKMGRQKGSGRARHGSITAPIYVGGGKAHGPQPKDWHLDLPKKMRRLALFSALSGKLQANEVRILSGLTKLEPKTKDASKVLITHYATDKKLPSILVVVPAKTDNIERALHNIPRVSVEIASQLHPYNVIQAKQVLLMKESIEALESTFIKKVKV